jgi:hypothetical protein
MLDVFTSESEILIKDGISNLYWYRGDLKKAWLKASIDSVLVNKLFSKKKADGNFTKRELMDLLYEELRDAEYNKRLQISRNFVRLLLEQKEFVPQDRNHRVDVTQRCALKLREITTEQNKQKEERELNQRNVIESQKGNYPYLLSKLKEKFFHIIKLDKQKRGYEFEKWFVELMKISKIQVEESFKIIGEQIDGAIKHDGRFYLVELKWTEEKVSGNEMSSLLYKVEGKMDAKGLFISMHGFSKELLHSLPRGKEMKVLLMDGTHLMNVIDGLYTFNRPVS